MVEQRDCCMVVLKAEKMAVLLGMSMVDLLGVHKVVEMADVLEKMMVLLVAGVKDNVTGSRKVELKVVQKGFPMVS